ncbi:hypothetical protein [Sunxiuqinia sp. sy24]|uniref:hypothetical protein n=1 Tax=Sunxiuqinia sp. sy24 TaxID=3461495 RepID=UPI004045AAD3
MHPSWQTNFAAKSYSDEAIAKLKESKDLLDLGLMEEADYEKVKAELAPVIMGQ